VFIQSRNSFSSSTLLLTLARDNGIGTIVGEPSGGKPSHYGDVLYCTLPNTATMVTVSHKHFVRPDKAIDEESLAPDVWVELNDPEKDMVWEWILEKYGKMVE
jgi:C-terminal processing protease CtpA/Prc